MAFKMFGWVPDGIWDYSEYLVRYQIEGGNPRTVISKMWLDQGVPEDIDPRFKLPWGSYPDFPPKPPKK